MDKYYKNGDLIYIWNDAYEKYEISKLTASFDPKLHQATLDVLKGIQVTVL